MATPDLVLFAKSGYPFILVLAGNLLSALPMLGENYFLIAQTQMVPGLVGRKLHLSNNTSSTMPSKKLREVPLLP